VVRAGMRKVFLALWESWILRNRVFACPRNGPWTNRLGYLVPDLERNGRWGK
jgi:hypothetical protein